VPYLSRSSSTTYQKRKRRIYTMQQVSTDDAISPAAALCCHATRHNSQSFRKYDCFTAEIYAGRLQYSELMSFSRISCKDEIIRLCAQTDWIDIWYTACLIPINITLANCSRRTDQQWQKRPYVWSWWRGKPTCSRFRSVERSCSGWMMGHSDRDVQRCTTIQTLSLYGVCMCLGAD